MPREPRLAAWLGVAALALGSLYAPNVGEAQGDRVAPSVAVGETAAVADPSLAPALRSALSDELGELRGVRLTNRERARYVLRGAVTHLERAPVRTGTRISCEVSLVLAERRGGSVRLLLSGRAEAHGGLSDHLEEAVLRAAVRGALRPLGSTLPRLR